MEKYPFGKSIIDTIKGRTSIRKYKEESLRLDDIEKLNIFLKEVKGPFETDVRFKIVNSTEVKRDKDIKLGTYGIIKGTSTFIAAVGDNKEWSLEQIGYTFEKVILYCTAIGLGTCWLGGTFNRGEFAKAVGLKEGEIMPVISPVGYPSESRGFVETVMRFAAGSKQRKPWEELFFDESFSESLRKDKSDCFEIPLEMLRLAPSASNKQPWRIVKQGNKLHFYLQHTKGYGNVHSIDIQKVDMGIAMCHFELALAEAGIKGKWENAKPDLKVPDSDTEYIISWSNEG